MRKEDAEVGMIVMFGRPNGEKTRSKIIKVNRKNIKVKILEKRGTKKIRPKGTIWNVDPSLVEPAYDEETLSSDVGTICNRKDRAKGGFGVTSTQKSQEEIREEAANKAAERSAKRLKANCDLANPPTYIKASRRYLDGTTIRVRGDEYDSQRQKLYNAENSCTRGIEFKTFRQAERYFEKILDSAWFNRRFERPNVTLRPGRGRGSACYSNGSIRLSTENHMCERILIHELTHALVPKPHAGHGRLFCAIYLDLVRHYMGEDAYEELLCGYRMEAVKYQPHRSEKR